MIRTSCLSSRCRFFAMMYSGMIAPTIGSIFVESRREDEMRGTRCGVLLVLETGQGHPEDREEEDQHDDPGDDAEYEPARQPGPLATLCRVHRPAIPSSLNRLEIRRRASVAMMIVATTT